MATMVRFSFDLCIECLCSADQPVRPAGVNANSYEMVKATEFRFDMVG